MILVTGATGFIGKQLCLYAATKGVQVRKALRSSVSDLNSIVVGELGPEIAWSQALRDIDVVVHLAARVHVMHETITDPLTEFRRINVDTTLNLARQAVDAGMRRFIFISSIKVNGEGTPLNQPYTADDVSSPLDLYGISKHEAELELMKIAAETGLEVVIIRPVLVYGPGVKANFLSMMQWLYKGIPLPLGAIHNKRSLVALDNLVDLIVTCIDHPAAANQTFLVSDGEDLSTTELLQRMAVALGKPARLLPVPAWLLKSGAALVGKGNMAQRLLGSLQVDIRKTREVLGWSPPVSVDEALQRTAEDFLAKMG